MPRNSVLRQDSIIVVRAAEGGEYNLAMPEFTPAHMGILERLVAQGFTPVAFPMYASAIGVRRESFAALLVPGGEAALKILGEPCYVIGSNLAVRTRREGRLVFVWKDKLVEATPELLKELARFSADLAKLLEP
jgi:hypothetical protein